MNEQKVQHLIKDSGKESTQGLIWRVSWCGIEQRNHLVLPSSPMPAESAPPICPKCEKAKAKADTD